MRGVIKRAGIEDRKMSGIGQRYSRYNDPSIGHIRLEDPRRVAKEDPTKSKSIWLNEAMARKVASEAIRQGVDPVRATGHLWYESLGGKESPGMMSQTAGKRYWAYVNPLHVSTRAHPDVYEKYNEIGDKIIPGGNFEAARSFAKAKEDSQNLLVGAGVGIMKDLTRRFGPEKAAGFYKGIGPDARTYGQELNTEMVPYLRSHPEINRIINEERKKVGGK
jgi:hypothetical protein